MGESQNKKLEKGGCGGLKVRNKSEKQVLME